MGSHFGTFFSLDLNWSVAEKFYNVPPTVRVCVSVCVHACVSVCVCISTIEGQCFMRACFLTRLAERPFPLIAQEEEDGEETIY